MAPSPKKSGVQAYAAELSLQQNLKSCLVNLPAPLVTVLDSNTVAQNVVIELTFRQSQPQKSPGKNDAKSIQKSIYVGWTGHPSKPKLTSVVGKDGLSGTRGNAPAKEREVQIVEIDSTFAQLLGLTDGLKVGVLLRVDPPEAHTVNIEPLSPADWEIIELHANFLELHMLSQIRALPNPAYKATGTSNFHPLTLHLSPTSTANVTVTSLEPAPSASSPFAKISPNAEVIVAPKTRTKAQQNTAVVDRSVRSAGGKSGTSTARNRSSRNDAARKAIYLRGIARSIAAEWFDSEKASENDSGLKIWVDWSVFTSKIMRGVTLVWVSILHPAGLQVPLDPQQQVQQNSEGQDAIKPALRIAAQLCAWEDAPNSEHVAMSSALCSALDCEFVAGETIRLESASTQVSKSAVKSLKVYPFSASSDRQTDSFRFGGKSNADREEAARRVMAMYGARPRGNGLLDGPITDGMLLPASNVGTDNLGWSGGILRLDPPPGPPLDPGKSTRGWTLGSEKRFNVDVLAEISKPSPNSKSWAVGDALPLDVPNLVGSDSLIVQLHSHITHFSSVLLTGGLGAGKTALAQLLGHRLRTENFAHITYFPCRTLITDETRVSTIKDTLNRAFALAAWNARLGGQALVILDDIDKLCPVETELQIGGENSRSRHVSETFISIVRQYCSRDTRVVLLATAQSKEAVNNVIIGGHVVREIVNLHAPDKEARRKVLESFVHKTSSRRLSNAQGVQTPEPETGEERGWLDGSSPGSVGPSSPASPRISSKLRQRASDDQSEQFVVDPDIDFLDVAGQSDGFMPGDLLLLVARARSEALIRTISSTSSNNAQEHPTVHLTSSDFAAALKGFTPASLRNVTLQHSTTTFSSIGGLKETRRTLLETLQYPTIYAPIFAKCPLRLRSGLLLYGYPGCGKTLLASAVAGECGLNFISVKGPEILNKYIGASEKSVRDLFERAQAARPCVLFFDEFDSVAPKRGHDSTGVTDRVVNQLLTQMDGAEGLSGVYVLAATSRPDMIDPALLRPGRLDKSLLCDMPAAADRLDILRAVSRKLRLAPSLLRDDDDAAAQDTLAAVARRTDGYSGADLQAVMYNAHLEAIHDVLGEHGSGSGARSRAPNCASTAVPAADAFSYFRVGDDDDTGAATPPVSAAAAATERAQIAARLAEQRAAGQRARQARAGGPAPAVPHKEERGAQEPVIEWRHVEKALQSTRASVSGAERRRLAAIYREFVVGRNGEMPSGQGGSEIGGRSSLM